MVQGRGASLTQSQLEGLSILIKGWLAEQGGKATVAHAARYFGVAEDDVQSAAVILSLRIEDGLLVIDTPPTKGHA